MTGEKYIEYLFLSYILQEDFDKVAAGRWMPKEDTKDIFREAVRESLRRYGFEVGAKYDFVADLHSTVLQEIGLIIDEGDEFTGQYSRFEVSGKDAYVKKELSENPIAKRIASLGPEALLRALSAISEQADWNSIDGDSASEMIEDHSLSEDIKIPASDRFVTLGHNQIQEIDESASELIQAVSEQNSIDGDPHARDWMLGQLKAGRELIRAGTFNAWLLHSAIMRLLSSLIERYKDAAIGVAARTLLEILIKHIFGDQ